MLKLFLQPFPQHNGLTLTQLASMGVIESTSAADTCSPHHFTSTHALSVRYSDFGISPPPCALWPQWWWGQWTTGSENTQCAPPKTSTRGAKKGKKKAPPPPMTLWVEARLFSLNKKNEKGGWTGGIGFFSLESLQYFTYGEYVRR